MSVPWFLITWGFCPSFGCPVHKTFSFLLLFPPRCLGLCPLQFTLSLTPWWPKLGILHYPLKCEQNTRFYSLLITVQVNKTLGILFFVLKWKYDGQNYILKSWRLLLPCMNLSLVWLWKYWTIEGNILYVSLISFTDRHKKNIYLPLFLLLNTSRTMHSTGKIFVKRT